MMLKNKIAVITGSNRGIGLATLIKFSENGADIIACTRQQNSDFEKLEEISNKYNNKITPVYFDLNKEEELDKGIKEIEQISDKIEIIVNNAGVNQISSFQMTSLKKSKKCFKLICFQILQLHKSL